MIWIGSADAKVLTPMNFVIHRYNKNLNSKVKLELQNVMMKIIFGFKTIAETIFKMDQTFRNFIEDKMLNKIQ
jgi:hypothetical protein